MYIETANYWDLSYWLMPLPKGTVVDRIAVISVELVGWLDK